jgi:hypothetical protein
MATTTWDLAGNTGNAANSFLGTTDALPVIVKTSNAERLRVDSSGNVGVGTASPHAMLHVISPAGGTGLLPAISAEGHADTGVFATSDAGFGVDARSNSGIGAQAQSQTNTGLFATSNSGMGVDARSNSGIAVRAQSHADTGVFATSDAGFGIDARSNSGIGIRAAGGQFAGFFQGDVTVTGDILLPGADCAESFDIIAGERAPDAGTVVVIDAGGQLRESRDAYDRKVAGVVSGGGEYRTAIVLDKRPSDTTRVPIALVGKVYCKVDAQYGAIEVGDLLTSSYTPGHPMRASEASRAFGAILGKALRPFAGGRGLIPILVALQ